MFLLLKFANFMTGNVQAGIPILFLQFSVAGFFISRGTRTAIWKTVKWELEKQFDRKVSSEKTRLETSENSGHVASRMRMLIDAREQIWRLSKVAHESF